ncbi:P-type ATPase [Clostridium sp. 'White wine YQ']|uniref:P-type ATPase n=1 Tax=Clostridium sp. 'White wine YQ' TaxID=3027474 RepID=UPI0023671DA0|nr:cation-transporting P-type ATPase [Clostridium sp. 'White wine YQ']MDD7794554.1 cation-transporting P-type ATPase [Clostridium sp. 'White wine YQ']
MINWYLNSWNKVVEFLESDIDYGLSEAEILKRRDKWGSNKINIIFEEKAWKTTFKSIKNVWFIIPILICIYGVYLGKYLSSIFTLAIPTGILILKLRQLVNRKKEMTTLSAISYGKITAVRDGRDKLINSEELVVGDIVIIDDRSIVPADIRIISSDNLKVNEKSLTGEEFLSEKYESKLTQEITSLGEIKNILFKGTKVVSGQVTGIVIATGNYTQLGKIMNMLNSTNIRKETINDKAENQWNKTLTLSLLFGIIVIVLGTMLKGTDQNFIFSILISSTSFGSIIVMMLFLRIINKTADKENINILNPSWIDLIDDIEVLFIDKVGSISKTQMNVSKIFTDGKYTNLEEDDKSNFNFIRLMEIGLLVNNATYNSSDDSGTGDLKDIAILKYAGIKHIYKAQVDSKNRRVFDIPMDFSKRIYTTINKVGKGYRANIKGNLDELLDYCTHIMKDGVEVEFTDEEREVIREKDYEISKEGLITQGVAYRNFSYEPSTSENIESNLVFVGIIALENPTNPSINDLLRRLIREKIHPILITEDNKITAATVGKEVGLIGDDTEVISGIELINSTKEEKIEILSKTKVFSKIVPELKNAIFTMFKEDNYKVCCTGEEVIDLPLLALSTLAIAKGKASALVKKVADLYIKEDCLEKLLFLKSLKREINKKIKSGKAFYWILIIAECLISLISFEFYGQAISNELTILAVNILILPLILIRNIFKKNMFEITPKNIFLRGMVIVVGSIVVKILTIDMVDYGFTAVGAFLLLTLIATFDVRFKKAEVE